MKKAHFLLFITLFTSFYGHSQCAMCKAVVESGDSSYAKGLNDGIVTLMVFPYVLVAIVTLVFWRYYKQQQTK